MTSHQPSPALPTPSEIASARWTKATASNTSSGCVEIAHLDRWTVIRDSKNPAGPIHCYTPHEWECFLDGAKNGEFDRP
jgi:Domain of unknown function (DUF397)